MDFDYELEKHYHPENFERDEEDEEIEEDTFDMKTLQYNIEIRNVILEGIKL